MDKRLVLKSVYVAPSGTEATVELAIDDRQVVGQASWSATMKDQLSVVAEATLNAAAQFLRSEVGLTLGRIMKAPDVMYARVDLRTPTQLHPLWGIAPLTDDHAGTVAKAILSAINRRSSLVFAEPAVSGGIVEQGVGTLVPTGPTAADTAPREEKTAAWEDSIKDQLAARGLTLDAEGNIIPLPVPERPIPSLPASPRRQIPAGLPDTYAQRYSSAERPEDSSTGSEVNGGGGGVAGRPSLSGVDGEDLWRLVEALIEQYRQDIFQRLGSPQQTNSVEDIKLAQGELKVLEWVFGLPSREARAIRSLPGAVVDGPNAKAAPRKRS